MNLSYQSYFNTNNRFKIASGFVFVILLNIFISSFIRNPEQKEYVVKSMPGAGFILDGKIDEKQWASCSVIKNFISPWVPAATDRTIFRAFHDNRYFYFSYIVQDSTMTVYKYVNEETVLGEDRVEMFLSQTAELKSYYGFEMDPQGKMTDYEAGSDHHFNFEWNSRELVTKTQKHKYGYELEGRVPLTFIKSISIPDAKELSVYAGVFRGDYYGVKMDDVIWFSWLKPASATPNFHLPSSFGVFRFAK